MAVRALLLEPHLAQRVSLITALRSVGIQSACVLDADELFGVLHLRPVDVVLAAFHDIGDARLDALAAASQRAGAQAVLTLPNFDPGREQRCAALGITVLRGRWDVTAVARALVHPALHT